MTQPSTDNVERGERALAELTQVLSESTDEEVGQLLRESSGFANLLNAILDRSKLSEHKNVAEFLLANKNRAQVMALVQNLATRLGAVRVKTDEGEDAFVSPHPAQWFEDGILMLEGGKPFEGLLAHYDSGKASYAVAKRDFKSGEKMGPDDFEFVGEEYAKELLSRFPEEVSRLEEPLRKLEALLESGDNDERKYQELIDDHPWILGAQHRHAQRHTTFDDKNIPDFTGARVSDGARDIFEIKPPFADLFRSSGEFNSTFLDAWDQAERYLDFAQRQRDYLYNEKGLRFENPKCYLILGYGLTEDELRAVHRKQRMSPSRIELLTYDELLALIRNTIELVKKLKDYDHLPGSLEDRDRATVP